MAAEKLRNQTEQKDMWDLSPLFTDDTAWESLFDSIKNRISEYDAFRGTLGQSAARLRAALDVDMELSRALDRLYTYAHLKNDEDKTNSVYTALLDRATMLYTRIAEASSFMTPEIHSIPDATMNGFLAESALEPYRYYLTRLLRYKPHTRSLEVEELLASSSDIAEAPSDIFSQLDNADFTFGTVTLPDGSTEALTHGNFSRMLMHQDRSFRERVFKQYYVTYDAHRHGIAAAYSASCRKDRFYARARKYPSALEASLFSDDVSPDVYNALLDAVKANIAPLSRYMDFRREYLKLDAVHFYDTYVPLVASVDFSMSYDEAVETCVAALAPLGEEYCATLRAGLTGGWVDRYENKGKRSGAYSSGCYDSPPYILMNYDAKNINSLYTLIHEAGHSMHSLLSIRRQPYQYHRYAIFAAEVASTFNELLLSEYLLKKYRDDPRMTAYILNREIDDIRATLYRQTMFAEYEKVMHDIAEADQPITIDVIREQYRKLLETYFGGSIAIDPELELEALRIPHFYHAFYVYKYATGISAAAALSRRVIEGVPGAVDSYLEFLSLGGSAFPIEELRVAGVDMAKPDAVNATLRYFSTVVDEFIATMKKI